MSEINYSNKAFFLSKDNSILSQVENAFELNQLTLEKQVKEFSSLDKIKERIIAEKGTSFFRKTLFDFIKNNGYPFLVFIDYDVDLGLQKGHSSNKQIILRTLLISYIVLSMVDQYKNCHLNLVLLADENNEEEVYNYQQFPVRLLDSIKTGNDKINYQIMQMKQNVLNFNKLFTVQIFNKSDLKLSGKDIIHNLIAEIKLKSDLKNKLRIKKEEKEAVIKIEPANILYKFSDNEVLINGNVSTYHDAFDLLKKDILYIKGDWTTKTLKEVNTRILDFIKDQNGFVKFSKDSSILINVGNECTIDNTLAASLAQLIVQRLSSFKEVIVYASKDNFSVLKESQGFSMLKNYLRISG